MTKRKAVNYLLEEYDVNDNLLEAYSFPADIWTINGDWIDKCVLSIKRSENGYKCVLTKVYDDGYGIVIETRH